MSFDTVCSIEKNVHDIEQGKCNWCGIPQAAVDHIATQAATIEELKAALERLAKLGNGNRRGNSIGNQIAIDALDALPTADTGNSAGDE